MEAVSPGGRRPTPETPLILPSTLSTHCSSRNTHAILGSQHAAFGYGRPLGAKTSASLAGGCALLMLLRLPTSRASTGACLSEHRQPQRHMQMKSEEAEGGRTCTPCSHSANHSPLPACRHRHPGGVVAPPAPLPQPASASEPLTLPEDETPSALPAARSLAEAAPAAPPEPPPAPPSASPPHPPGLHQRPAGPAAASLCTVPWAASRVGVEAAQCRRRPRAPPPRRRCLPPQRREAWWWERGARGSRQAQAARRLACQRGGASRRARQLSRARPGA